MNPNYYYRYNQRKPIIKLVWYRNKFGDLMSKTVEY